MHGHTDCIYTHIHFYNNWRPCHISLGFKCNQELFLTVFKNQIGGNMGVMISVSVLVLKYAETTEPNRK